MQKAKETKKKQKTERRKNIVVPKENRTSKYQINQIKSRSRE